MERGKIIVIEGTDCSGKETQSKKLIEKLNKEGEETVYYSFPKYDTPTGRIVGLPYLGKPYLAEELINQYRERIVKALGNKYRGIDEKILVNVVLDQVVECLSTGWFPEGAPQVDPKISSLYYAADRAYNVPVIESILESGKNIVLDRYTYSNMAHQGGKILDDEMRYVTYEWIKNLEFDMLNLPQSDVRLFLHMPTDYATFLRKNRDEALDENERDINHLRHAERAYLEVANMYDFSTIDCVKSRGDEPRFEDIKTPDMISKEVYDIVKKELKLK